MAFWSKETLKARLAADDVVSDYDPRRIKHSSYELSMGSEYYPTGAETKTKISIGDGEQISILPGQFAILLTQEMVCIPKDAIGFISIKASIKFRGLVNVSGFHVDPGFQGPLKFSVYNAGSKEIVLEHGAPVFLLWLASLDRETSYGYDGNHAGSGITADDVMNINGATIAPPELAARIETLERFVRGAKIAFGTILTIVFIPLLLWIVQEFASPAIDSLRTQAYTVTQHNSTNASIPVENPR